MNLIVLTIRILCQLFITFLYDNPRFKHTWFFNLYPATLHKGVPTWFSDWWHKREANLEILPDPILKLYIIWVDTHPVIHNMKENNIFVGLCPMYFFHRDFLDMERDHSIGMG